MSIIDEMIEEEYKKEAEKYGGMPLRNVISSDRINVLKELKKRLKSKRTPKDLQYCGKMFTEKEVEEIVLLALKVKSEWLRQKFFTW